MGCNTRKNEHKERGYWKKKGKRVEGKKVELQLLIYGIYFPRLD